MRPGFSLGAELPGHGDDAGHDDAGNYSVAPPVGRLRVPTTGRGPDVLGVAVGNGVRIARSRCRRSVGRSTYGTFPPPPWINCQRHITGLDEEFTYHLESIDNER